MGDTRLQVANSLLLTQDGNKGLNHSPLESPALTNGDLPGRTRRKGNILSKVIEGGRTAVGDLIQKHKKLVKNVVLLGLFVAYNGYVATAVAYGTRHDQPMEWCDGLGFLIILTAIIWWSLFYYIVLKGIFGKAINKAVLIPMGRMLKTLFAIK